MPTLPLSRGLVARVDQADFAAVAKFKWSANVGPYTTYALRATPRGKGPRTTIQLHRFILAAKPGQIVDHENGDGLDNRRRNLRFTDKSGNAANRRGLDSNNRTGYRGVSRSKSKAGWRARIHVRGVEMVIIP